MRRTNPNNGKISVLRDKESKRQLAAATAIWPHLSASQKQQLSSLLTLGFSVSNGDLQLLENRWYVTHAGLLGIARRNHCSGIQTEVVPELSDPRTNRWVVRATAYKTPHSKGFVGYGDADPSNVSPLVRGAEMRVAETRAVNRALRKAYGIGLCSVEELGAGPTKMSRDDASGSNGHNGYQPRLRDRLLLLIRQYHLDAEQVKRYATRFCDTDSLRQATRDQVEAFVNHLVARAAEDRDQLIADMSACDHELEAEEPIAARDGKEEGRTNNKEAA